ncbi:MAG: c-type cytochrome [Rhodothermales bacterium]
MKNALKIFGFTIVVTAFYAYVALWVPGKRTDPPEDIEIGANLTTDEMVEIGKEIVSGKGTCLSCHTIGEEGTLRFPDLEGIGSLAATRKEGYSDIEYLAESLYEPDAYVVEGFAPGMPAIARPPIALNDQEILTIIAYLQSLGGTPSVTMDTGLRWQAQSPAPAASDPPAAPSSDRDGPTLFAAFMCNTCHSLDGTPGAGPSLQDVGSRLSKAAIYESLMEPDAVITEGFPPGVMTAMLQANGFKEKISAKELQTLVDYLAAQTGP